MTDACRLGRVAAAPSAKSRQDLIEALEKTLGCPMLSERVLP